MSFDPDILAAIADGLEATGQTALATVRVKSAGQWSLPSDPIRVSRTAASRGETFDGRQTRIVNRATIRAYDPVKRGTVPMVVRLGDEVTYGGVVYFLKDISGADLTRWMLEVEEPIAAAQNGRLQAEGRP